MRRVLAVLVATLGLGAMGVGLVGPAVAADGDERPDTCLVMKDGRLPECIQNSDGTWTASYPGAGVGTGGSSLAALFLLVAMAGVGIAVWRLTLTRSAARDAGTDPDQGHVTDEAYADRRREIIDDS